MNIRNLGLFILIILFSSCKDEDTLTSAQLIANELESIIEKNQVTVFDIRSEDNNTVDGGIKFIQSGNERIYQFRGELICFDDRCFNLNRLIDTDLQIYQSPDDNDLPMLVLIFDK
jgi:hypothetical protein